MDWSDHRPGVRLGSVLLSLSVLAPAAGCTSHEAPKARVDQTTAAPVPALADTGPVPGSITESWHVDIPRAVESHNAPDRPPPPRLVNGQLVEASSRGLDVYDANTGRERWHYREPGRGFLGYIATAGALVAMTYQGDDPDDLSQGRQVGLDASTGRTLWTRRNDGVGFTTGTGAIVAGGGVVPMLKGEHDDVAFGVDARSGHTRWKRDRVGERGCETDADTSRETDGSLLLFRETCHGSKRILALDPATGRERWRKDVSRPGDETPETGVSGGIALIRFEDDYRVIAADGRELTRGTELGCYVDCRLQTVAGHALVMPVGDQRGVSSPSRTLVVDTRTGHTTTSPIGAAYLALTAAGGSVYGLHSHIFEADVTRLLPSGLDVIDPATGTVRPRPLPFATSVLGNDPGETPPDWLAVAGGRVYTRRSLDKTIRVTSYATTEPGGPAALGGVRAADWPDTCHIAPGLKAGDFPPAADRAATIGSTTLRNVACRVGDESTLVRTEWVAASPEQAHTLLTMPATARKTHVDGADEAFSLDDESEAWLRVGRYVMQVFDLDARTRTRVASAVAKGLRNR
jgi:outer membrane protein assembly factor BamB